MFSHWNCSFWKEYPKQRKLTHLAIFAGIIIFTSLASLFLSQYIFLLLNLLTVKFEAGWLNTTLEEHLFWPQINHRQNSVFFFPKCSFTLILHVLECVGILESFPMSWHQFPSCHCIAKGDFFSWSSCIQW